MQGRSHVLRVQWLSAGLHLQLPNKERTLELESRHLVSMGLAITIPQGYYGHMVPCNSLALRGADIVAGVIDSNYPEEVKPQCCCSPSQPCTLTVLHAYML
uniref:dUTPase-like domain-containing protein n=1 Tax=Apteryx owenii TaxID=8824 RepID=A0A8B9QCC3_APTOW